MTRLSRRAYLATAAAAVSGLAGCNASNGSETTTGDGVGATPTATPTETPDATATATPTAVAPNATISGTSPTLVDADPEIVVEGPAPGSEVTLTATTTAADGREWQSAATFEADDDGVVRVSQQAPLEGTYEGVEGAGLLWSMRPVGDVPPERAWFVPPGRDAAEMTVSARTNGVTVAETTLVRQFGAPGVTTERVDADHVVGTFVAPDVADTRPGILVLHGSAGDPDVFTATMLASHGYPALAVKYFGSEAPIPDDLLEVPLSYFDRAAEWLRARPTVREGDLGVYGASKGGEGALFLAAYADWVGAVVADVPSGVAFEGLTPEWRWAGSSSWAVDGDPVPYVPGGGCFADTTEDGLYRMAAAYECALSGADERTVADATFAVENGDGPILCVSGERDEMWPSPRLSEFAVERLREHDAADRIDHRAYEAAGHAIPIPYRPSYGLSAGNGLLLGGTPAGIGRASADWWPRALETFGRGLE